MAKATIADFRKQMKKDIGESIFRDLSKEEDTIKRIKLSSPNLNLLYGGGFPRGRIIELYGPESGGKSILAIIHAIDLQHDNLPILWVDMERTFSKIFYNTIGLDTSDELFALAEPETGEEAYDLIKSASQSGLFGLIIVDSVSAMTPKAEMESNTSDAQMGVMARMMGRGLRTINSAISKSDCSIIFINQLRMKIGFVMGNPETTSGGNALKFFASVRNRVSKMEEILNEKKEVIGQKIKIINHKNKIAVPKRTVEIEIYFEGGLDSVGEYIDHAITNGFIERSGAWYTIPNLEGKWQGKEKLKEYLLSSVAIYDTIKDKVDNTFLLKVKELPKVVAIEEDEFDNDATIEEMDG